MSRWFRMYDEMLDDPKVQMLSPELFKTWVNLLAVASRHKGLLPPVEKLAFALRVSTHEMQSRIEELILFGLLDIRADGKHEPHNWSQRQWKSDDSADRVRKHREAKRECNGYIAVTVTPPESYTDTDKDPHGLPSSLDAARARVEDRKVVNRFGRGQDEGKIEKIARRAEGLGIPSDDLIASVNRHKPRNRPAYFTKLCVEWLQPKLPGLDEKIIRDAIWGHDAQYVAVTRALLEAA